MPIPEISTDLSRGTAVVLLTEKNILRTKLRAFDDAREEHERAKMLAEKGDLRNVRGGLIELPELPLTESLQASLVSALCRITGRRS